AKRYAFMFWGHSSGPAGLFLDQLCNTCISKPLPIKALTTALEDHVPSRGRGSRSPGDAPAFDIVLFNDCWMDNLETAVHLADVAEFIIASQGIVPFTNWSYEAMFARLAEGGDSEAVASALVELLGDFYDKAKNRPKRDEVPFALLNLRKA